MSVILNEWQLSLIVVIAATFVLGFSFGFALGAAIGKAGSIAEWWHHRHDEA